MNESQRLADQLERALNGDAWHGPSWREALEGVGLQAALQRPIPNAHGIGEIVLHVTTWQDVARRRLAGETPPQPTDEQDWPRASFASEAEWRAATERLFETGRALAETIARFPEARLLEERGNQTGTWYALMIGILQHDLYHAGQVGLLKKAAVPVAA
jgi:uncharacterized damage-inducible protein DinB